MRVWRGILFSIFLVIQSACSIGGGKNESPQPTYRTINPECQDLKIAGRALDATGFKALLHCLNSQHALDPVQNLVDRMSVGDLQPLVDAFNHLVLDPQSRLYEILRTYEMAEASGKLDPFFTAFGNALSDRGELLSSLVLLLRDSYRSNSEHSQLLNVFPRLAPRLTESQWSNRLDELRLWVGSRAAQDLGKKLKNLAKSSRGLEALSADLQKFVRQNRQHPERDPIELAFLAVADGRFYQASDLLLGKGPDLRVRVPRLASVFKVALAGDGNLFGQIRDLAQGLDQGIPCFGGAREVLGGGARHALREWVIRPPGSLRDWVSRSKLLEVTALNPFCDFPPALALNYSAFVQFVNSSAADPADELVRALVRTDLAEFLLSAVEANGPLTDWLKELINRDALEDFILLTQFGSLASQKQSQADFEYYTALVPSLAGQSVYRVLADVMARAEPSHFAQWIQALAHFTDRPDSVILPLVDSLRDLQQLNDVHPFISILQDWVSDSGEQARFLETVFKISDYPEFAEYTGLLSKMSSDGRLKKLLGSLVTLLKPLALEGRAREVLATSPQPSILKRAHDWDANDLVPYLAQLYPLNSQDPCLGVHLNVKMDNYSSAEFDRQLKNYLNCMAETPVNADFSTAIKWLDARKLSDGRSGFQLLVESIKSLRLSSAQAADWVDRLISTLRPQGNFDRASRAFGLWSPAFDPLVHSVGAVYPSVRSEVGRLFEFAGDLVAREDLSEALEYLERADRRPPLTNPKTPGPQQDPLLLDRIKVAVRNHECVTEAGHQAKRGGEIVADYREAIEGWSLEGDRPPRDRKLPQFKSRIQPLLKKLSDPKHQGPVADSLLRFLGYFSLPDEARPNRTQHFSAEYFGQWLSERARDERLIAYFYPGESELASKPRVRVVNSLDRLELMLINADFVLFSGLDNYGLKFLADIGMAWGDESPELWPSLVREKFDRDHQVPPKLVDAYHAIKRMIELSETGLGYPAYGRCSGASPDEISIPLTFPERLPAFLKLPFPKEVRKAIFNLRQVLPVIEENLPESGNGGMKVLRDLFYELYAATPQDYRTPTSGDRNNLSVAVQLVRLGLTREVGRRLRELPSLPEASTSVTHDLLVSFLASAQSPHTSALLDQILVKDSGQVLFWQTLSALFKTIDRSPADSSNMKDLLTYLFSDLGNLRLIDRSVELIETSIQDHGEWLRKQPNVIEDFLGSKDASTLARKVFESRDDRGYPAFAGIVTDVIKRPGLVNDLLSIAQKIDESPSATASGTEFTRLYKQIRESREYQQLELGTLGREWIQFLRTREPPGTAQQLRLGLSQYLRGDAARFVGLMLEDPDGFTALLNALAHHFEAGDVRRLLELGQRNLVKSVRARNEDSLIVPH